jgi:hypothetical protein
VPLKSDSMRIRQIPSHLLATSDAIGRPDAVRKIAITLIGSILAVILLTSCKTTAPDPVAGKPATANEKMEERSDGGGDSM